ncbi:YybS family protein [Sporosarcina sp. ACRSM]|uniref:YybS family protein n=1 Tax=Sporosarcina sp. ACRSM TaxID=2918216 RepID=UPI001EF62533|nr:YybS family protein [Sporosarcina sp. ACRSM]MCG7335120.1 YybS family protein [Sporosarcina sp. ACRSM]
MMKDDPRKITYGAMMIALFAILLAIILYVPPIGTITMFLIPLPIILYGLRYDRASTILVTGAGMIVSLLIGGIALLPFAFVFGLAGWMIAEMIKAGRSKLYLFMGLALMYIVTSIITYVGAVLLFNINFVEQLFTMMRESQKQFASFMGTYGTLPASYNEMTEELFTFYEHTVPAAFILTCFLFAFITLIPNLFFAKRLGHEVPKFPPFRNMKLPVITVLAYGVVLLLNMTVAMEPGTDLYLICVNATIILRTLFLLQGIALIHFYLHETKLPKAVTVVGTLFALFLHPVTTLLGVLDAGVNIRAWISKDKSR